MGAIGMINTTMRTNWDESIETFLDRRSKTSAFIVLHGDGLDWFSDETAGRSMKIFPIALIIPSDFTRVKTLIYPAHNRPYFPCSTINSLSSLVLRYYIPPLPQPTSQWTKMDPCRLYGDGQAMLWLNSTSGSTLAWPQAFWCNWAYMEMM